MEDAENVKELDVLADHDSVCEFVALEDIESIDEAEELDVNLLRVAELDLDAKLELEDEEKAEEVIEDEADIIELREWVFEYDKVELKDPDADRDDDAVEVCVQEKQIVSNKTEQGIVLAQLQTEQGLQYNCPNRSL